MCAQTVQPPDRPRITPIQWVGLAVLILLLLNQMGLLRVGDSPSSILATVTADLPRLVALLLAIPIHEFSHGLVATAFGDDTPRKAGRLTLNPLKHLDPLGTLLILVAPFGWGRPMPINPSAMRNPNLGWALSSIAGPVSNVLAAAACVGVFTLLYGSFDAPLRQFLSGRTMDYTQLFFVTFFLINVSLAVFNLVPLPPLDGFGFVFGLVPRAVKILLLPIRQYGPIILLALVLVPALRPFLNIYLGVGQRLIFGLLGVHPFGV